MMTQSARAEDNQPDVQAPFDNGFAPPEAQTAPSRNGATPDQPSAPPAEHPQAGEEHIGTFHAFRYPNYRWLWIGDLMTAAAMWTQQTALGWVVYTLTGSGQILGAINGARVIPTLLFSPIAGVASDRMSRTRIIVVSQLTMFFMTILVGLGLAYDRIEVWYLFVFTFIVGTAQTFYMPARQTFVFELVPRRVIPNAVALSWMAFSLSRAVGPAVGGVLIVLLGASQNFFLQSVAFLGVVVAVLMITAPARPVPANRPSFFQNMRDGYGFAFTNPLARVMVLMSVISPLLIIPLHAALLPIFAERSFHAGAAGLGVLVGSIGFGGLFGGILTASLNWVDRRGLLQLGALFIFSLSETVFCILAYITGDLLVSVPFLVVAGVAESIYTTTNSSVLQLLAPDHLRGSMAAVLQLSFLVMPLGAIVAGTGADRFGAPAVGGVMTFTAFCVGFSILVFSPRIRALRLREITGRSEPAGTGSR